ncbi:methionyl-tRNA formyltransferase [Paracoccus aerodenitrificans]|uniref:methionyl-tRNA formyltransferase n=1 Tax=Paracoccus aerodenitrificans TaxID=3017781 RepID=UPI0022F084AC|nr:formyltransferase family protein [Paracoccus aerodenitrificans]WBU63458.1 formyltransferase family protein [Paracoccus aerodenitrificans]
MKTAFIGAVEGSAVALRTLCEKGQSPDLVVTLPVELAGAHSDFADLGPLAADYGLRLMRSPRSESDEVMAALRQLQPDLVMIIGWSQLIGPGMIALPRLGVLGFHPSPLPRMRGRAVLPWQILTRQSQGGATLFWIGEGVDDGPIAAQSVFTIDPDRITVRELYDKAVAEMACLLPPLVADLAAGNRPAMPQNHENATICARRRAEDGMIDWSLPATEIDRLIRAVGPPYPGATTRASKGAEVTITAARVHPREGYYIGLPGQIQNIDGQIVTVMAGDGRCIDLLEWRGVESFLRHEKLRGASC